MKEVQTQTTPSIVLAHPLGMHPSSLQRTSEGCHNNDEAESHVAAVVWISAAAHSPRHCQVIHLHAFDEVLGQREVAILRVQQVLNNLIIDLTESE